MVQRIESETGMAASANKSAKTGKYQVSDEVLNWVETTAGMLAHIRTHYGSAGEMIEHPQWDASRNGYAAAMLTGLKNEISQLAREFKDHAQNYSQNR